MSKVIGIDLGTTNSVVAVMEGGEPTVITNHDQQRVEQWLQDSPCSHRPERAIDYQQPSGECIHLCILHHQARGYRYQGLGRV